MGGNILFWQVLFYFNCYSLFNSCCSFCVFTGKYAMQLFTVNIIPERNTDLKRSELRIWSLHNSGSLTLNDESFTKTPWSVNSSRFINLICSFFFWKHHHLNPNTVTWLWLVYLGSGWNRLLKTDVIDLHLETNSKSLSLEESSKDHMDPEIATPQTAVADSVGHKRAVTRHIPVLARNHSFLWVDSWDVQVATIPKTYSSAKSIQKLGCVAISGPVDSMEFYPCIWFFSINPSSFFVAVSFWNLSEFIVFYNTLTQFCNSVLVFITCWYSLSQRPTPRKARHFFFKFLAAALRSINHVFKFNECDYTTPQPKTTVTGPRLATNAKILPTPKKGFSEKLSNQDLPSKKRQPWFKFWWFSGSTVPPRSQGWFSPHRGAMIWSVTSQVDVFFSQSFFNKSEMPNHVQLRSMFFFGGTMRMIRDHHIKMFGDKMSQLLQSTFQQHGRWDMTSLWMCVSQHVSNKGIQH